MKMHDHRVNLTVRGLGHPEWIKSSYAVHGHSVDEIVENLGAGSEEARDVRLHVEYVLGKKNLSDVHHLIKPYFPTSIRFVRSVMPEGYLCQAEGETEEACFSVLIRGNSVSEARIKEMLEAHQEALCFLAYRQAHEGSHAQYGDNEKAQSLIGGVMLTPYLG